MCVSFSIGYISQIHAIKKLTNKKIKKMKKEQIYLDLSKCTEEEIKEIPQILEKAREAVFSLTRVDLKNGNLEGGNLLEFFVDEWVNTDYKGFSATTELTYPEFIKLFEGGEERTELLPDVAYWRHRCLLAEKCLSVSPCDSDITEEQIKAHKDYNQYLETFGNKD